MAINPSAEYGSQVITSDPAYPYGKAKNETSPGLKNGTPLEAAWPSDIWGFFQSLLVRAGFTPSGQPDKVGASQYMDALDKRFGTTGDLVGSGFEAIAGAPTHHVLDCAAQEADPEACFYSADGAYAYVAGGNAVVYRYELGEPFDLNTASHSGNVYDLGTDRGGLPTRIYSIWMSADGFQLLLTGYDVIGQPMIYGVSLPTAWSLTGAAFVSEIVAPSYASQAIQSASYNNDGSAIYAYGLNASQNPTVIDYSLGTPYSPSTASLSGRDFNQSLLPNEVPVGHAISDDGVRLFCLTSRYLREYKLETPGDVSTAVDFYRRRDMSASFGLQLGSMGISATGVRAIYTLANTTFIVSQYSSVVRYA